MSQLFRRKVNNPDSGDAAANANNVKDEAKALLAAVEGGDAKAANKLSKSELERAVRPLSKLTFLERMMYDTSLYPNYVSNHQYGMMINVELHVEGGVPTRD